MDNGDDNDIGKIDKIDKDGTCREVKMRWEARIIRISRIMDKMDKMQRFIDRGYTNIFKDPGTYALGNEHVDKMRRERLLINDTFSELFEMIALFIGDFAELLKMLEEKGDQDTK